VDRRRVAVVTLLLLAGMGVRAAPASATFHLNKVNEVMLASSSGGASVQFVEFLDKGGSAEIFPPTMGPFKLVVYDAAGNKLGEHVLSGPALSSARAAGRPYLVSTVAADIAFDVTGDERLDVTLPQGAGQVCFVATAQSEAYSCLTWGRLTKAIPTNQNSGTGSANGAAPLPGQSAQRQPDDTIQSAPPTPKAANRAGTAAPSPTRRFAGMRVAASRVKVDRTGRARVPLRCPAGTNGPCKGRLTLRDRGTTIGRASFTLRRGRTRTVKVKLSRAARRKLARAGVSAPALGWPPKTRSARAGRRPGESRSSGPGRARRRPRSMSLSGMGACLPRRHGRAAGRSDSGLVTAASCATSSS